MTEPPVPDPSEPVDVTTLVVAVRGLSRNVKGLADRTRRNRFWLTVTAVGLVLDILLSGLVWRLADQQKCQLHRSQALAGPVHDVFSDLGALFDDIDPRNSAQASRPKLEADVHALRVATDAYKTAAKQHPPTCALF